MLVARHWHGRAAFAMTMLAVAYSAGLLVWAIEAPLSAPRVAPALLVSLVMWALLHRRCTQGGRAVAWAAAGLAVVFLAYSVLGAVSIAAGAFPAAIALSIAPALTPG